MISVSGENTKARQKTHSEDGVDLTVIRWMLRLSPTERLEALQQQVNALMELRRGAGSR